MSDKPREEHQRQEPEDVQQPETATGAAQDGQQPLKEEPPERETLPEDEELLRQWETMTPEEREKLSEQYKAIKDKWADLANPLEGIDTTLADLKNPLADMVNPLGDALEQWKEAEAQRQQQLNEILNRTTAALPDMSNISKQLSDSIRAALPDMSALSASLVESTTAAMRQIAESGLKIASFYESTSFTALQELVSGFDDYVEEREKQFEAGDFTFLGAFVDNVDELLPYIKEEIEAYKKETGKETVTFDEFMFHATDPETGEEKASILEKVLERAQERADQDAAAAEAARNVEEAKKSLPHFFTPPGDKKTLFPLDKFNWRIWHNVPAGEQIAIKMESNIKGLNRDGQQITGRFLTSRALTEDHFRVFLAVCNLYNRGVSNMTPAQIFRETGHRGEPSADQMEKIIALLSDMLSTTIYMDNREWAAAKGEKTYINRTFQLLRGEILDERAVFNGQIVNGYVSIAEKPVLFDYADGLKQITLFPTEVLSAPVNKTPTTGIYEHYLLDKIGHAKRRAGKNKSGKATASFKWDTIFEYAGATDKRAKARAKQYVKRYLDHYKACGEIESYSISGNTGTSTIKIVCKPK